ncbi:MAG: site-specific DNA-methyltransferase [Spirochaetes bacterium]|nr:site-specific DNA-methyltransferase [Spirochaetota bacterium]
MARESLPRIDTSPTLRTQLLPYCRLKPGEVWEDPLSGHRVGVLDATREDQVCLLMKGEVSVLGIHDPPYNISVGNRSSPNLFQTDLEKYLSFSRAWVQVALKHLARDASFYVFLGADQNAGFQPLPDFMILMRSFPELKSRSFITLRNQRGYGTQKNWMAVRQELLYYVKGNPFFQVQYTKIPKILRGYYKEIKGARKENLERGKSPYIRPGNVWVDIQQVFYRMEENVSGAYAQKPLKAIQRIIEASSRPSDLVTDYFSHAGTTLLACEILGRRCYTLDIDPVFAELTLRRLEHFRRTGKTGWQTENPFPESTSFRSLNSIDR